ncbi:MAG: hypothetical protein KDD69_19640, partial [Bdellovibrionales bacterium]|nr:hypothetical protein [Bdellovibrionales bacterium]
LICGSTAVVTSTVVLFVLLAALGANLAVERNLFRSSNKAFATLLFSLLVSFAVTFADTGFLPLVLEIMIRGAILVLPIFFAGACFSLELERGASAPHVLSANLIGAMAGGILEYSSMLLGFRALYLLAGALYLSAFVASRLRRIR